jgi:D-arabinose 1-dehydrogenase-like Zn-dependent alcohol dehydrogenase
MKAKAAVLPGEGMPFEIREYEVLPPAPGEVVVKMAASGICGTDAHIVSGRLPLGLYPIVIGHELAGTVHAVAPDAAGKGLKPGDRVLVGVAVPCGACALCEAGDGANCPSMRCTYFHSPDLPPHLYGGYAEYCHAPASNAVPIPDGLPLLTALVFACAGPTIVHAFKAPSARALAGVRTAVVQGLGPVGLFAAMYLKRSLGVRTVLAVTTGANPRRDELAAALGVDAFLTIKGSDEAARRADVLARSEGAGADLAVECSGSPEAFREGLGLLRNRGIYLVPGQYSNSGPVAVEPQTITFKALQVFGSAQYDAADMRDYLAFLAAHRELWPAIDAVCTHVWPLERVNDAMAAVISGEAVKTVLVPGPEDTP